MSEIIRLRTMLWDVLDYKKLFKKWYNRVNTYIRICSIWRYIGVKHIGAKTYQSFKLSELNTIRWIRARLIPRIRASLISEFESIIALSEFSMSEFDTFRGVELELPLIKVLLFFPIRRVYYQSLENMFYASLYSFFWGCLCFSPFFL